MGWLARQTLLARACARVSMTARRGCGCGCWSRRLVHMRAIEEWRVAAREDLPSLVRLVVRL